MSLIFGSAGRFSEDLDFTLDSDRRDDDVRTELVEVFNTEYHGITFTFNEYYKTDDDTSFGGQVLYSHRWNETGRFRLQVSLRERPTLPVVAGAMKQQAYFDHLEFDLFDWDDIQRLVRTSNRIEPGAIIAAVENRFNVLRQLTELERQVNADAKSGWNEPLADRLRAEIRALAAG